MWIAPVKFLIGKRRTPPPPPSPQKVKDYEVGYLETDVIHQLGFVSGAFTFVYLVLMSLLGLPMLYMEMALGQYARGGPISAWKITPLSRGTTASFLWTRV